MNIFCPACDAPYVDAPEVLTSAACKKCGVQVSIGSRFVLVEERPVERGEDVVDSAAPVRPGVDLDTGNNISIRVAPPRMKVRVEREATILKGLQKLAVPRVVGTAEILGGGSALVTTPPPFATLEAQVQDGLRIGDAEVRLLIAGLLDALGTLHRVSPPVFHRNLHPGTIAWDGAHGIHLLDFARATDIVDDAASDLVVARPGYAPSASTSPAQLDLFGLAASVVHVLSRRPVSEIALKENGTPDIRPTIVVSDAVEGFLELLLSPNDKRAPKTIEEAKNEWGRRTAPVRGPRRQDAPRRKQAVPMLIAMFALLSAGIAAAGVFLVAESPGPGPLPVVLPAPITPSTRWQQPGVVPPITPRSTTKKVAPAKKKTAKKRTPKTVEQPRVPIKPAAPSPALEFRRKLKAAESSLVACDDAATERIRLKVEMGESGKVLKATQVGRTRGEAAKCISDIVKAISLPASKVPKKVTLDVWVWTHPTFKVNVF